MTAPKTATAILLTALLALPAAAQNTTTQTETPAEDASDAPAADDAPAPTPSAPGGDLAVGAPTQSGPQIYVREEHGDWEVRCLRAPEGQEDPCQLYQRLSDAQGQPTADINFFDLPDGGEIVAGATLLTPLQTLLTAQVRLSVDGGQERTYPYSFCDPSGCYARMGFTAEDIQGFRRGALARVVVIPALAPDQPAELDMSLSGFTAGLAAVEVSNPE
ncbi:MAG: invasion associated locus B family protein [Pseudomonadota bacterium]